MSQVGEEKCESNTEKTPIRTRAQQTDEKPDVSCKSAIVNMGETEGCDNEGKSHTDGFSILTFDRASAFFGDEDDDDASAFFEDGGETTSPPHRKGDEQPQPTSKNVVPLTSIHTSTLSSQPKNGEYSDQLVEPDGDWLYKIGDDEICGAKSNNLSL
jgi:hypothetical protein